MKKMIALSLLVLLSLHIVACSVESGTQDTFVSSSTGAANSETETVDTSGAISADNEETTPLGAVVTTGQALSFDAEGNVVELSQTDAFYGQDGEYESIAFSFTDNQDGTISDNNTGLMWIAIPEAEKMSYLDALEYVENLEYAGHSDWRLPSPEELFSISDFSQGWPYLDTSYFKFNEASQGGGAQGGEPQGGGAQGGEPQADGAQGGEPQADTSTTTQDNPSDEASKEGGQFWTNALSNVEGDERLQGIAFGVNHMTGHIKAYPAQSAQMGKYVRAVRGDVYGVEDYTKNEDGTTTDNTSGLMWTTVDLGECVDWETALNLAENSEYAGYTDWRLPDVKELQSIVDYSGSYPAINQDYFELTTHEENENYYYWTSTSAYFSEASPEYDSAWYVAFGYTSHGAGAVRFSPKYEGSDALSEGEDNILNSVRLVRNVA